MNDITIKTPTGSMDAPTELVTTICNAMMNKQNWKLPTSTFRTANKDTAEDVAYGLEWYLGGSETVVDRNGDYIVSSKGYYHYIGV